MPDRDHIPIEDFHEDIIGKVIRGKHLKIPQLATAAGLEAAQIEALLDGEVDEEAIRALAPQLGLDPNALIISANKIWRPQPVGLTSGLAVFNTVWGDMRVNAYVVWDPASRKAAIFDTGADATGLIRFIEKHQLIINSIYLTHTHGDHIAELPRVIKHFPGATTYVHRLERISGIDSEDIDEGHIGAIGELALLARHTHGHSKGGTTYLITGLERPLAIVGDSLFAGSMGGGKISFPDALKNNREKILTLPDDTVICPGHGPLSSVAEEKAHNPFFPELK
ncbi:MAG: MBL fold metallo-hydrolase [Verrucomicrobiales bacterium]